MEEDERRETVLVSQADPHVGAQMSQTNAHIFAFRHTSLPLDHHVLFDKGRFKLQNCPTEAGLLVMALATSPTEYPRCRVIFSKEEEKAQVKHVWPLWDSSAVVNVSVTQISYTLNQPILGLAQM